MSGITVDTLDYSVHSIQIIDNAGHALDINADGSINTSITALNAEKAEDSAHVSGDTGHFILGVRQDTKASLAGTDGDYTSFIFDADGDLYVSDTVAQGHLSTLAGTVSGSEIQVDVVGALPAGDNNIGNVDVVTLPSLPAGTNNIGDVDVLTMPATQVVDAAAAGGETGLFMLGIRQDAAGSPVSADGDFHPFVFNDDGELKVVADIDDVANTSVVVTNASVDTTVGGTRLITSALSSRRDYTIQNLGSQDIWCKHLTGTTAGTSGNGFLIPAKSSATYNWGPTIDIYAITASGTADVKVIEAS